jgi:hypothetical protein
MLRRSRESVPSPTPKGVKFEEHDHDNDQKVQDKAKNHPRHAPQYGERPMLGPVQAATGVFEGAARGTEGTALLSNAGCSRPNRSESPHRQPRL